jgi:NAD+ kinase
MITTIGVVLKPGVTEAVAGLEKLRALAADARFLVEATGHHALAKVPKGVEAVDARTFEHEAGLVVVLGGDGTLIHAASLLQERVVPILGINLGRIGLLTEATRDDFASAFARAREGALPHSDRLRLEAELRRGGATVLSQRILNDAVVAQLALARIAVYRVMREDELVTVIRGDGVIVSTPTGSTAYSLAAGGSILSPELEAVAITPICPHALTQRAVVLRPQGEITICLESDSTVFATLDGQVGHEFKRGDTLVVRPSPVPTRLLTVPGRSYFQTLRQKLRWGEA